MRRSITPLGFVRALRSMTDKSYGRGEGAPDGIYPFCTINSGPTYRPYIAALQARPLA